MAMNSRRGAEAHAAGERRLTAEYVAARALLEAATLQDAIPQVLGGICETLGWEHGALWMVDHERDVLRCAHVWMTHPDSFPEFASGSRALTFTRGVGLPGRVWASREPHWIRDVSVDANFPRAAVASREGLHTALGFPVLLRGEVHSVLEFFSRDIREPDQELLATLGTVGHQIGMFIDRRRAQDELDRFFMLSLDLLCVAGYDGFFKRVNPAWQRVLGYSEHDLLTQPYLALVHPDDRESTLEASRKLASGAELVYFENRFLHKDGTHRWLLWAAAPYPEQQVIYATAHDITERKAAEEMLARYARDLQSTHHQLEDQAARLAQLVRELEVAKGRAEDATEAKSAFLANMSHEIRTPLNAILGTAGIALESRLNAEQRDYFTTIRASGEALLEVVNDILDFSKIEARKLDLEHTPFDVRETVGEAVKVLALRAAEKGLELATHIAPDVPMMLRGDPGRLRQVLLNVVGNAVKFTARGEVVANVSVEANGPDTVTLHFAVRDTGIGISPEMHQQIFQAFTQADASTTREYGGTGLGLTIAARLVELMHGRLWLESDLGRGSTFHFSAVFDRVPETARERSARRPKALDGLRVLVVDDNATNRRILEEMLASWRMKASVAADADSALEALARAADNAEAFDAVIVDGQMPRVDGFALARRMKRDRRLQATPIVMLTSAGRPGEIARCRRAGVESYLVKPVKHSDVLDSLVTIFGATSPRPAPPASIARRSERPLRVLVAEDNAVNRKLVATLLEKRGHRVKAVENGREAVEAVANVQGAGYDVVLMDLQMPQMSGFEATQAIRDREGASRHRLPIVALTAHAMQGDRERCLAAGMDGYLSKPINVGELIGTIEQLARRDGPHAPSPRPASRAPGPLVFDEAAALAQTAGDRRLLKEVIALFRTDAPSYLRRIARALARNDGEAARMAAHGFKGALAAVGSERGREIAQELERHAADGRVHEAGARLTRLRDHLRLLDEAFTARGWIPRAPAARAPARRAPAKRSAAPRNARKRGRAS